MTKSEIKTDVKSFILNEFLPGENPENLPDSMELITTGILDSLATLRLVAYLEETYRIEVAPHELHAGHLNTIASIAKFVGSKQAYA